MNTLNLPFLTFIALLLAPLTRAASSTSGRAKKQFPISYAKSGATAGPTLLQAATAAVACKLRLTNSRRGS